MKKYLLITSIFFISCKSSDKKEDKIEKTDTTSVVQGDTGNIVMHGDTDNMVRQNPPPQGKIDIETFGEIKIGQAHTDLLKALGEPGTKSKPVVWEADGLMHEDWTYKSKGVVINLSSEKKNSDKAIFSITANSNCNFKTRANMGIGNTYEEVTDVYKRDIDTDPTTKETIVVGSVYGGIIFSFENNKVKSVYLGPAAE